MSEELPDVYIRKTDANRTGYDYVGTDYRTSPEQIQYTPHSKLQEAINNWQQFALVKLGIERDKMSPSDVEAVQRFLGVRSTTNE